MKSRKLNSHPEWDLRCLDSVDSRQRTDAIDFPGFCLLPGNAQIPKVALKQKLCGMWQVPKGTWEGSGLLVLPMHLPQPSQCFIRPPCTLRPISSLAIRHVRAGLPGSTHGTLCAKHSPFPWTVVILFNSHKTLQGWYCYYPHCTDRETMTQRG